MSKRTQRSARPKFVIQPHPYLAHRNDLEAKASLALEHLDNAFTRILHGHEKSVSYDFLYRNAYNLVISKFGDGLYDLVKRHVNVGAEHCSRYCTHKRFTLFWIMVRDITFYMEKTYVIVKRKKPVKDLALDAWDKRCNKSVRMYVRARVIGRLSLNRMLWNEARYAPGMAGALAGLEHWMANGGDR